MWTRERMPLYLAALSSLFLAATAYYNEEYRKFLKQHQDHPKTTLMNAEYCEVLMNYKTLFKPCKPLNIFIHTSETQLRDVCGAGGTPYHGTGKRKSRGSYPITICRLAMMTMARQCLYYAAFTTKHLVLSCDKNRLPVSLDETLTMSG